MHERLQQVRAMMRNSSIRTRFARRVSQKRKQGTPGGEYIFDYAGKHYELPGRFIIDRESPSDDGLRWVATPESGREIRRIVCELADKQCELGSSPTCWKWAPLPQGQPHHVRHAKMGGAFTEDRIWITIEGEVWQMRIWACPNCHQRHHNPLHWTKKSEAA